MKNKQKIKFEKDVKYQLTGWFLFILCAVFFLASGIQNRDTLTIIGSVLFLIACFFFLIPLAGLPDKSVKDLEKRETDESNTDHEM